MSALRSEPVCPDRAATQDALARLAARCPARAVHPGTAAECSRLPHIASSPGSGLARSSPRHGAGPSFLMAHHRDLIAALDQKTAYALQRTYLKRPAASSAQFAAAGHHPAECILIELRAPCARRHRVSVSGRDAKRGTKYAQHLTENSTSRFVVFKWNLICMPECVIEMKRDISDYPGKRLDG